jgi:hypothetical protein
MPPKDRWSRSSTLAHPEFIRERAGDRASMPGAGLPVQNGVYALVPKCDKPLDHRELRQRVLVAPGDVLPGDVVKRIARMPEDLLVLLVPRVEGARVVSTTSSARTRRSVGTCRSCVRSIIARAGRGVARPYSYTYGFVVDNVNVSVFE